MTSVLLNLLHLGYLCQSYVLQTANTNKEKNNKKDVT